MDNFTGTCQRYTDVMAHKYYLQELLFNKSINGTVTIQLALVIVKLQVMANSLQAIEVCVCINM